MSRDLPERRMRAGDADRDQVLTVVQRAYEEGRLDLEEMKDRQERALKAKFTDELPALVADLPEGLTLVVPDGAPVVPRPDDLPDTGLTDAGFGVSIMSGRDVTLQRGTREFSNLAFWGGNNIDLTSAMGPGRIVTLTLHAIMGGNDVVVPEGVRVIDQSVAIMAGNGIAAEAQGDGSNGTLVLKGFLWWGGNDVKLRAARDPRG
jgi:hypothetical protein